MADRPGLSRRPVIGTLSRRDWALRPRPPRWSAEQSYAFQHLVTGYPGDDLFYFGWSHERTGADACIRRAPD